jgi:elongation factor G
MSGMGTLHLEIKRHRMERDFRLKIRLYPPRVSYRETIREAREVVGECVRQAGTSGLFAKVAVNFEPYKGPEPIRVETIIEPDVLTPLYLASAEQGIRGALDSGELGFPVMKVKATIVGGSMDEQLSNETAFAAAGADAVHKAMRDNIVLLEPMMALEVTVPEEYLGPITSDLNARRAEINEILTRGRLRVVEAIVPLRQMFDYADKVRSLSQGRASSTMEPHAYAPAPDEVLHALLHPEDAY